MRYERNQRILTRLLSGVLCGMSFCTLLTAFAGAAEHDQTVAAYLQAGEFQPAVQYANSMTEQSVRDALLKQIAEFQVQHDELDAARATTNRMSRSGERSEVTASRSRSKSLGGGAADFDSLIELIETVVEPLTWEAVGGLGTITEFDTGGGIYVDADGLLSRKMEKQSGSALQDLAKSARIADLNTDMSQPSALRVVSLTRLEQAVRERMESGLPVVESMKNLAGLYRVEHIFIYPETGEIVIAGPAAGWQYTAAGMPVSSTTQWPTLQLDDLVTLLRTYGPEGQRIFGCSIDPRPEGLQELTSYVNESNARGALSPRAVRSWANQLQRKLGLQNVTIYGVPEDSRVARVIVEADYRMKLIGIGEVEGGSKIPDFFELMTAEQAAANGSLDALRWWLSLRCESVLHSSDRDAFRIQESSVLCQSENQFVTAKGERVATGTAEQNNRQFASNLTNNFEELASRDLVFADLQNIFDLAIVSGLISQQQLTERVNWDLGSFASRGEYEPAQYAVPRQVDSVVNHKVFNGKNIVVQVAGGVQVNLTSTLSSIQESSRLDQAAENAQAQNLAPGRWWWDASK
ncbi:MAG: DUF1598 domain-containing protein [Planctomycetaceae bacterium]|nr:DUF1598 domain-containing protein [Planctomycetaceae bacterium]